MATPGDDFSGERSGAGAADEDKLPISSFWCISAFFCCTLSEEQFFFLFFIIRKLL